MSNLEDRSRNGNSALTGRAQQTNFCSRQAKMNGSPGGVPQREKDNGSSVPVMQKLKTVTL